MADLRKNLLFRIAAVCFIAVQLAFSLPHHHHGPDEVPCLNFTHCASAAPEDCLCIYNSPEPDNCSDHATCSVQHISFPVCDHTGDLACDHDGHRHDLPGTDCYFYHSEITPPERDRDISSVIFISSLPEYHDVVPCGCHAREYASAHQDTVTSIDIGIYRGITPLHHIYIPSAIPARAPSFTV